MLRLSRSEHERELWLKPLQSFRLAGSLRWGGLFGRGFCFWCFLFIRSTGVARMGPRGGPLPDRGCSEALGGPPFDRGRRRPSGWPPFDRGRSDWPSGGRPPYDRGRSKVLGGASVRQWSLGLAMGTSSSRVVTQIGLEEALLESGRSNGPLGSFVQRSGH